MCGGPDWPVSVICGIMRIPIREPLIGLVPIAFTIIPTATMTALKAFMPHAGGGWALLSTAMLLLFFLAQAGSMVLFGVFVEKTLREKKEAIAQIENDAEVEQ